MRKNAAALMPKFVLPLSRVRMGLGVVVDTTLNLSGSVAQYGRASGVIRGVANHLTTEFANNLKSQINAERTNSSSQPTDSPKAANPISAFGLLVKSCSVLAGRTFQLSKGHCQRKTNRFAKAVILRVSGCKLLRNGLAKTIKLDDLPAATQPRIRKLVEALAAPFNP